MARNIPGTRDRLFQVGANVLAVRTAVEDCKTNRDYSSKVCLSVNIHKRTKKPEGTKKTRTPIDVYSGGTKTMVTGDDVDSDDLFSVCYLRIPLVACPCQAKDMHDDDGGGG